MEKYIFKRKIYNRLLEWKNQSGGEKALLIEGARRIGKTTIAKEFGENEYDSYIYLDFQKGDPELLRIFSDLSDINRFYSELFLYAKKALKPRKGLIIFDEVQFSPRARMSVKALTEDGRYDILETGSLISLRHRLPKDEPFMIPSEEQRIEMHPLDFEEYCWAIGIDPSVFDLLRGIAKGELPLSYIGEVAHREWMKKVRSYLILGGMPQSIAKFIATNDYYAAHTEKRDIVSLYKDDLSLLDEKYSTRCRLAYETLPKRMRDNGSGRYIMRDIYRRATAKKAKETLIDLADSKIVNFIYACLDPSPGLGLTKDDTRFKIYSGDVGLFSNLYLDFNGEDDVRDYYQRLNSDKLDSNLGSLYEHFVLQNLISSGHNPYYFAYQDEKTNKRYEIDFLLYKKGKIIPIEVKSSKAYSASSLLNFKQKYHQHLGKSYIFSPKMPKEEDGITYLPLYMAGLI